MADRRAVLVLALVACGGRGAEPAARPEPTTARAASVPPEDAAPPAETRAEDAGALVETADAAFADANPPPWANVRATTKLTVTGGLDAVAVKAQVARHKSLFQACFDMVTQRNPDFRGRALFSFTIDTTGRVGIAHLDTSTFGDGHLESCILRQVRSIVFPARVDPTNVVAFPITLAGSD